MTSSDLVTVTRQLNGTRATVVYWYTATTHPNSIINAWPTKTSILDGTVWIKPTPSPSTKTPALSATRQVSSRSLRSATPVSAKTAPAKHTATSRSGALSTQSEVGIGVAVGIVSLLAFGLLMFYFARKRKHRASPLEIDVSDARDAAGEKGDMFGGYSARDHTAQSRKDELRVDTARAELDDTESRKIELSDARSPTELDAAAFNPREVHEVPDTHPQDDLQESKPETTRLSKPPPIPYASKPKQVTISSYETESETG